MFNFHLKTKIVFGQSANIALSAELKTLGADHILLVSDPGLEKLGLVDDLTAAVKAENIRVTLFTRVTSNPTTDEVAEGLALARGEKINALVALGGGSPIDVAKGIAMLLSNGGTYADYQWGGKAITLRSAPLVAIPTTAGTGSEVSKVAVIVDPKNSFKKGVLSPLMFPHAAIVDPTLTRGLPPDLTAATGMDAFIHALEAYIGLRANPFTDQFALASLRTAYENLPRAVADGKDIQAREKMMLAALWGGIAMDHAGLGLVHSLSGPLSAHGHLHHGLSNALILPYVLRFNSPDIPPTRLKTLKNLFGLNVKQNENDLFEVARDFVTELGLPTTLSEINIKLDDKERHRIAAETMRMVLIKNNPRTTSEADCIALLEEMAPL
ncbi:MAG: iron-containing alcohol dehydrogenase [Chloroflexi bacterium]|nr:iron-containing alcohol dehydrogenase [Chloroflexota bacterium]